MTLKQKILALMGVVGFIIWSILAYKVAGLRGGYETFVVSVVTAVSAIVLHDSNPPPQG